MPTGYTNIGTILKIDGAAVAAVSAMPDGLNVSGPGALDTTVLAPTGKFKTNIPDGVLGVEPFTVEVVAANGSMKTFTDYAVACALHDIQIDTPTGESFYMDAAHTGKGWISDVKLSGAAGASSPGCEKITFTIHPTGIPVFAATAGAWYTGVTTLGIAGGDFGLVVGGSPVQLTVIATYGTSGFSIVAPVADLSFVSGTPANATVGANTGIVTWISNGGATTITCAITAAPTIDTMCICTTA